MKGRRGMPSDPTNGVQPPVLPHSSAAAHRQYVDPATKTLQAPNPRSPPELSTRAAQHDADAGHSRLDAHRGAHARFPEASLTQTAAAPQQTAPHACISVQQAPPTQVCPLAHAPPGLAGLHGLGDGATHAPPTHACPLGQARPQEPQFALSVWTLVHTSPHRACAAPHIGGGVPAHAPFAHVCPTPHVPHERPQPSSPQTRPTHEQVSVGRGEVGSVPHPTAHASANKTTLKSLIESSRPECLPAGACIS